MKAIERILLTTNLAPHSDRAMERAVQLARQHAADLTALYAIEARPGQVSATPYDRVDRHDIEAEILRHAGTIRDAEAPSVQALAMQGEIHEVAAEYAETWKADLMVAGAHRIDMLRDLFAVTTVERISVASQTPLLVVRNRPFRPYASALVAVDFSPVSRMAVEWALALVPEGSILLLHVDTVTDFSLVGQAPHDQSSFAPNFAALLAGLDTTGRAVGTRVRWGYPMLGIAETAAEDPSDLIVMGTSGRTGLGRTLLGSVAHEVLERLPSDVLLARR